MSLGEFRYWLAHGGDEEYAHWREAWAIEAHWERERAEAARAQVTSRPRRNGFQAMRLGPGP